MRGVAGIGIPTGGIIGDGSPEVNARGKVLEKNGIPLRELEHVGTTNSTAGISTEQIHMYLAPYSEGDRQAEGGGQWASTRTSKWLSYR